MDTWTTRQTTSQCTQPYGEVVCHSIPAQRSLELNAVNALHLGNIIGEAMRWKDRKAFVADLKAVYQAPTREVAETRLLQLAERWSERYPVAVRSWENNWEDLATMFDYPADIRRLIYTTNRVEGYNR